MKTLEEMAMEYIKDVETARNPSVTAMAFPQMQRCFLAGYKAAQDQLADADKVMCSTTMEEIRAVDTGEIIPITNLPKPAQWISVKDRLPEEVLVLIVTKKGRVTVGTYEAENKLWTALDPYLLGYIDSVHYPSVMYWMELPAPPKEEK